MTEEARPENGPDNTYYKQLRESEYKLESEIRSMREMPEARIEEHGAMIGYLSSVMMDVLTELRSQPEPDKVFAVALKGLNKVQQEQFLLENILESLKRNEELPEIMSRFADLGLLSNLEPPPGPAQENRVEMEAEEEIETTDGSFFLRLSRKMGKSSMLLAKIALNAARAAGKFVEVVPVIGFTGPIPTVSLQLQPKGASIDELIEIVMDTLEQV